LQPPDVVKEGKDNATRQNERRRVVISLEHATDMSEEIDTVGGTNREMVYSIFVT
jgi:hypothetical protein